MSDATFISGLHLDSKLILQVLWGISPLPVDSSHPATLVASPSKVPAVLTKVQEKPKRGRHVFIAVTAANSVLSQKHYAADLDPTQDCAPHFRTLNVVSNV